MGTTTISIMNSSFIFIFFLCFISESYQEQSHTNHHVQQWLVQSHTNQCLGYNLTIETCDENNLWNFEQIRNQYGWNIKTIYQNLKDQENIKLNQCLQRKENFDIGLIECGDSEQNKKSENLWDHRWILEPSPMRKIRKHNVNNKSEYILVWREWLRHRQLCLHQSVFRNKTENDQNDQKKHQLKLTSNPKKCAVFNVIEISDIKNSYMIHKQQKKENLENNNLATFITTSIFEKFSSNKHSQFKIQTLANNHQQEDIQSRHLLHSSKQRSNVLKPLTESNEINAETTNDESSTGSTSTKVLKQNKKKNAMKTKQQQQGWIDSRTNMMLSYEFNSQNDLNNRLTSNINHRHHHQFLVGGGIYAKWGLPLYMVGLYVETNAEPFIDSYLYAKCFYNASTLINQFNHQNKICETLIGSNEFDDEFYNEQIHELLKPGSLMKDESFYLSLTAPSFYDKTISVKLAIGASPNQVRSSLLSLWKMSSKHKQLLLDASMVLEKRNQQIKEKQLHKLQQNTGDNDNEEEDEEEKQCCSRGDEVSFTIRGRTGSLEMRLNGEVLVESLLEPIGVKIAKDIENEFEVTHGIAISFLSQKSNSFKQLSHEMDQLKDKDGSISLTRAIMFQFTTDDPEINMSMEARDGFVQRIPLLIQPRDVKRSIQRLKQWFPVGSTTSSSNCHESRKEGNTVESIHTHAIAGDVRADDLQWLEGDKNMMLILKNMNEFLHVFAFGGTFWFTRIHHHHSSPDKDVLTYVPFGLNTSTSVRFEIDGRNSVQSGQRIKHNLGGLATVLNRPFRDDSSFSSRPTSATFSKFSFINEKDFQLKTMDFFTDFKVLEDFWRSLQHQHHSHFQKYPLLNHTSSSSVSSLFSSSSPKEVTKFLLPPTYSFKQKPNYLNLSFQFEEFIENLFSDVVVGLANSYVYSGGIFPIGEPQFKKHHPSKHHRLDHANENLKKYDEHKSTSRANLQQPKKLVFKKVYDQSYVFGAIAVLVTLIALFWLRQQQVTTTR